jgi:hypothetical protein
VGAVLVFYYPWISLSGYVLSEPPFTLLLGATVYHGLACADRARPRDAWLAGGALALASAFRPQILLAVPLYGLCFLLRAPRVRARWKRLLPGFAAPLALVLGFSAARTLYHTGKLGLVSNNGPLNFAFGRCHAVTIASTAPDRQSSYQPPPFMALQGYEATHPGALFKLDPAMGPKLHFEGHMYDRGPLSRMASDCVERTGLWRQVKYAVTHAVLLWGYNVIWPDQGQARFRPTMEAAQVAHNILVLPAALAATLLALRRRHARTLLLALHVYALVIVAMLYFGDTRLRAPYDGVLITLAVATYAAALRWIYRRIRLRR